MDHEKDLAAQLASEVDENELLIKQCQESLELDPRSQHLIELLESHLDRRISLRERFEDLARSRKDPWSSTKQNEPVKGS